MSNIKLKTLASSSEILNRNQLSESFRACPIPDNEIVANVGIFQKRQELTKMLFFHELYKEYIVNCHGVIMEFGVRWGQNMVTLNNLRGIYEPFNHNRKLIGFDTFEGFPVLNEKDGKHDVIEKGAFSVTKDYEQYLEDVLNCHEKESPLSHIKKNYLIKGDASVELEKYLNENPQTIISFAWFDFDIYEPTKRCLELIKPHITKGTVLGFDELNDRDFQGETVALKEVLGLSNCRVQRNRFSGMQSFIVVE